MSIVMLTVFYLIVSVWDLVSLKKMLIEEVQAHLEYGLNHLIGEIDTSYGKVKDHSILIESGFRNYSTPEKWNLTD